MQNAYHLQSPVAQQRGTQAFGLAATTPIIDPNLTHHPFQFSQVSQGFASNANINAMANEGLSAQQNTHTQRTLPEKNVTDETIDDAYVQFLLYCNPSIPSDVDTAELKRGFRNPPRSDGKTFSVFALYELIARLLREEIKSWTQLVTELGVELPDISKNQSTQKLQQYGVRLKRWLHAYHVDAFFQYLCSVSNSYYTSIPSPDSSPATARDGVPVEEDLALRALLPERRPKRGRRKADDTPLANEETNNASKRAMHQRSNSAEVFGAFNDSIEAAPNAPWSAQPQDHDPWAAAHVAIAPNTPSTVRTPSSSQLSSAVRGLKFRWQTDDSTPYTHSAIPGQHMFPITPSIEEPKSAGPLNSAKSPRSRKKHGLAVSSAWQGGSVGDKGKLRGRPPSNRSVQDGPYSTFPANPNPKETSTISTGTPTQSMSPSPGQSSTGATNGQTAQADQTVVRKPSKLQLQVPEHAGGPVRLATPPTVLINGESGRSSSGHERSTSADFFGSFDEASDDGIDIDGDDGNVDWKRRALLLKRKLQEKEAELKAMKRRVLDAVM